MAVQDIDEISAYLSQFYASTFKKFLVMLENHISHLQTNPYIGTVYKEYRKLVVSDYLIFYKVDDKEQAVKIYRVLHSAQDLKNL